MCCGWVYIMQERMLGRNGRSWWDSRMKFLGRFGLKCRFRPKDLKDSGTETKVHQVANLYRNDNLHNLSRLGDLKILRRGTWTWKAELRVFSNSRLNCHLSEQGQTPNLLLYRPSKSASATAYCLQYVSNGSHYTDCYDNPAATVHSTTLRTR